MKLFYSTTLAIALSAFGNTTAYAQETYPNRPITLIVPYSPGGATDIRSRQLAVKLGELLNANIVVENRAGG